MTMQVSNDEAMLAYLAGEDAVVEAAQQIWNASGRIVDAQRDLERATKAYQAAITGSGIPSQHAERLGAALILRLNRERLLGEAERAERSQPPGHTP